MPFMTHILGAAGRTAMAVSRHPLPPISRAMRTSAHAGASAASRRTAWKTAAKFSLATALGLGTYTLGSVYPPTVLSILYPRPAPAPISDETPESQAYKISLEEKLQNLPPLKELRSREDADDWYEARPYSAYPEERRVNHLTAGALRGPGRLAIPPVFRVRKDETEAWAFIHLGRGLCGHDGIVHGGLLATLLDESLGRLALVNLPDHVGVTANLSINYRAPTMADQFVVIKLKLDDVNGRKCNVSGRVEDLEGKTLAEASALFVRPRYAKLLNPHHLKAAMGENSATPDDVPAPPPVRMNNPESIKGGMKAPS